MEAINLKERLEAIDAELSIVRKLGWTNVSQQRRGGLAEAAVLGLALGYFAAIVFVAAVALVVAASISWGATPSFSSSPNHSTENAFSCVGASAPCYRRGENIWIVPVVVPELKFSDVQRQILPAYV